MHLIEEQHSAATVCHENACHSPVLPVVLQSASDAHIQSLLL
jgi:hypothetical protein